MTRFKPLLASLMCAGLACAALPAQAEQRTLRVYNWFDYPEDPE